MSRKSLVWAIVILALFAAAAWHRYAPRTVPAGQPPLATLDASAIAALRDDFNRHSDAVRVIVLLSPT